MNQCSYFLRLSRITETNIGKPYIAMQEITANRKVWSLLFFELLVLTGSVSSWDDSFLSVGDLLKVYDPE